MLPKKSLYVLIRNDLQSTAYKAVQAGHAVAEYVLTYPEEWKNYRLIYVLVRDELALEMFGLTFLAKGILHVVFREPDLDNEFTAMACATEDDSLFKKLPLLE